MTFFFGKEMNDNRGSMFRKFLHGTKLYFFASLTSMHTTHPVQNVIFFPFMSDKYSLFKIQFQSQFFWKTIPIYFVFTNHQKEKNLKSHLLIFLTAALVTNFISKALHLNDFPGPCVPTCPLHSLQSSPANFFLKFCKVLSPFLVQCPTSACSIDLKYSRHPHLPLPNSFYFGLGINDTFSETPF